MAKKFSKHRRGRRTPNNNKIEEGMRQETRFLKIMEKNHKHFPSCLQGIEKASRALDDEGVDVVCKLEDGTRFYLQVTISPDKAERLKREGSLIPCVLIGPTDSSRKIFSEVKDLIKRLHDQHLRAKANASLFLAA